MTNFSFLKAKTEYALFAPACMEAEKIYVSAPAMCAVGCRKALELAVKWVYAADKSMKMPYKDNLQSLIHEPTFRFAVDSDTWGKMPFIIKLGNLAVHTERSVQPSDALASLRGLFEFVQWIDYETRETKTLSENIFGKQIKIAMALQENTFAGEDYQAWRKEIVNTCHKQVMALNSDLIAVKLRMQYVEKYKKPEAFVSISEGDKGELLTQIAPLVRSDEADEFAKRFDNFMYGLILAHIEQMPAFQYAKKQLCDTASLLERKASIPQIKAKLPMLQEIHTDAFWDANDILLFEQVRKELRELIRFLDEGGVAQRQIVTKLTDPIIDSQEGVQLEAAYDFEDYRAKVNRYVNEHGNTLAIYKLTHNIPLAMGDYQELERVLTSELGSKEDYAREFGDTPFGLLIRKIAKLDHEAAMQAFSAFINDQSLNQKQIAFVNKIINHIELNGYMENVAELTKPPFDKPISFIKLFDAKTRTALMETINQVRENAVQITAS